MWGKVWGMSVKVSVKVGKIAFFHIFYFRKKQTFSNHSKIPTLLKFPPDPQMAINSQKMDFFDAGGESSVHSINWFRKIKKI